MDERLQLMVTLDNPLFQNWDQDSTAVESHYEEQDPAVVAVELTAAGERLAADLDGVEGAAWQRPGVRSNGAHFTVETLGRYMLHDVVHHLFDVAPETAAP